MNVLVIGDEDDVNECRQKFGNGHNYSHERSQHRTRTSFDQCEVVFDFMREPESDRLEMYRGIQSPVFINTAKISLLQLNHKLNPPLPIHQFGFAGLPTFLNREVLEVSLHQTQHWETLNSICKQLNTSYQTVEDRVGLVTPRVICMIINEAYFTVQEGTASRHDIDLAMKLGTHYPYGPFEWCQKIGLCHVYELLQAVYEDTRDERYNVCPLLKNEYLTL
jgi:3-hydroxybutyryl-CoA dehydrogenase